MKKNQDYNKQGMDLKRLMLRMQGKIWLLLMLIVLGAGIGGVSYQVARAMRMPITYEAVSKLYISFGVDESGEIYQYYNGYTWNELLDTDPIISKIEENLPAGYTREQVIEATEGTILSDIRLLTVTVQGSDEKSVREIQAAVELGLENYAQESEELKRIDTIRTQEPERVYWDDKTVTACVTGAVILTVVGVIVLALIYVMDDAVYVQADIEKRYPYKALGMMMESQKGLQPYARELTANITYLLGDNRKFALIDTDNHIDLRAGELERLLNAGENEFIGGDGEMGGLTWTMPKEEGAQKEDAYEALPLNESAVTGEDCAQIRQLGGAILLLPYGVDVTKKTERIISLLNNQDCKILGIIVTQADEDFLSRYYGA
ncbi:MAG: hypothetical protein IJ029_02940 [Lachnospiraceae bacterium]|nr:hypothetical protein [Lachnospiraceae bacterium]